MATVRLQVRRGTASQWTSINPILAAGEMGLESDTNFIKFGDGTHLWSELGYANEPLSALQNTLADYVLLEDVGVANGIASLNASGKVPSAQLDIDELSQDAVNTALIGGDGITKTYNDGSNTITLDVDITSGGGLKIASNKLTVDDTIVQKRVTNVTDTEIGYLDGVTSAIQTQINAKSATADVPGIVDSTIIGGANVETSYNSGTKKLTVKTSNDITITGTLNADDVMSNTATIDGELHAGSVTIEGDLTVGGTYSTVPVETLTVTNPMIYMAESNPANIVDIGIVGSKTQNSTYSHTGFVKDATDGKWKLFSGVVAEPTTTVDFTTWTKDDMQLGDIYTTGLHAEDAAIGDVTNEEIQFLSGVSSPIQDQFDNKQDLIVNASNTEIGYLSGVTSAIQTQLNDKAALSSPTFTGTVALPADTNIGTVSNTEIGYLDGVTSAIQTQINNKQDAVSGVSNTEIGYLDGVTSAIQTQFNNKQDVVSGVSSTEIGYLDGVTSAIQTQLDSKLGTTTASNTYQTLVSGVSNTEIGYLDGVTSAIQTQIDAKAPLASPTFTGTVTLPANTISQSMMSDDSVGTNEIGGLAVTTEKIADSAVTSAKIADLTIVNGDISASAAIALSKLATDPLARANHTGSQTASTISDFDEAAQDAIGGILGTGLTYNDASNTITIDSTNIQLRVSGVSDTEIGYLDGVTSAIQTQIDSKLNSSTASTTYAPIASPTFTGTVSGVTKSHVGLGNVDNTSDANKPVSTATQTALDLKANLSGPTFTGTVVLPSTTSIGNVSSTEIGYVDGVTSAIQTQLDDKLSKTGGTMTGALTLSGAPTSDLHAATKLYVDGVAAGINFHKAVRIATTSNWSAVYANGTNGYGATLTASANESINPADGVTLSVGDRILVKSQTDAKQNGIYDVTNVGSGSSKWVITRSSDDDNNPSGEVAGGDFTFVTEGSTNANTGFILSSPSGTAILGTDNITYTQFNAAQAIVAGTGLAKTGATLSIDTATTVDKTTAQTLTNKTLISPTITGTGAIAGTFTGNITGNVTGTVSGNAGTVTNGVYTTDTGTVTNTMLAGSIADSKLSTISTSGKVSNSATTATNLNTVSAIVARDASGNFTAGTITAALTGNASTATKLAATKNINGTAFDGSADITITAANPNALTIGTGLSGTSYTGSGAVTIAIDSTVATLTGTQTLTNKTLTSPSISGMSVSGTTTYAAGGLIQFSDATQQSTAGVPSLTTIVAKTASYTLTATTERDNLFTVTSGSSSTFSIPTDASVNYPIGTSIDIVQLGTGQVTIAAVTPGTTNVYYTPGNKLRSQYSSATITKIAANTWLLTGDLTA